MNVSSKKRASSSGKGQWVDWRFPVAPLLTIKNICSIMGENKKRYTGVYYERERGNQETD